MVARTLSRKIATETAQKGGATPEQAERLARWVESWAGDWARDREHSPRTVRTACANYLAHLKAGN